MTRPQQPRIEAARTVSSLLREVQLADSDMMMEVGYACNRDDGTMYGASRYSGNFSQMHQSYGDLINLLYELDNAWSGNCYFEDPAANADYWCGRVTRSAATGAWRIWRPTRPMWAERVRDGGARGAPRWRCAGR